MSFGKMNTFIEIIATAPDKDTEGFTSMGDTTLANVRAYKEERHGSEIWANRAAFSTASALFRFRMIPGLKIDTRLVILMRKRPVSDIERGKCKGTQHVY